MTSLRLWRTSGHGALFAIRSRSASKVEGATHLVTYFYIVDLSERDGREWRSDKTRST